MNANLRTWLTWCRASADDITLTDHERALWKQLADHIDHYLEEHP